MIHPTSKISIHALRGEGDYRGTLYSVSSSEFLSTPSVGRATGQRPGRPLDALISIHALRGEGDRQADQRLAGCCEFLSTPSVGRATHRAAVLARRRLYFYPRPPWGGRPIVSVTGADRRMISIHALRGEGDPDRPARRRRLVYFYPRPPWGGRRQKCLKNSCTFVSNHTIGSLIYREILPEPQRNRQNNLCFTPKIRCDSPG